MINFKLTDSQVSMINTAIDYALKDTRNDYPLVECHGTHICDAMLVNIKEEYIQLCTYKNASDYSSECSDLIRDDIQLDNAIRLVIKDRVTPKTNLPAEWRPSTQAIRDAVDKVDKVVAKHYKKSTNWKEDAEHEIKTRYGHLEMAIFAWSLM